MRVGLYSFFALLLLLSNVNANNVLDFIQPLTIVGDATTIVDDQSSELQKQVLYSQYVAQIDMDTVYRAQANLLKPLPPPEQIKKRQLAKAISRILYQNMEKMNEEPYYTAEVITTSVPERPYIEEKSAFMLEDGRIAYRVKRSGVKITRTEKGLEKIKDYDSGITQVSYRGRVIKPIVCQEHGQEDGQEFLSSMRADVTISYDRFELHIEENYYNANAADLDAFFDEFELRFDLLESRTGWSSEQFYGEKLDIFVTGTTGCGGGASIPTEVTIHFKDPFNDSFCNINTSFMELALHEALHGINPLPLFFRDWLTEGFSQYEQYNTLVEYADLTQIQADNAIYAGDYNSYDWQSYIANDYRDTTSNNYEIQLSEGYDITAWMFTMMREDHAMAFSDLYALFNENHDTLDKADSMWQTSDYFTDMVIIDLFGRAAGYDFAATKDIWEYDSPSGPGWGVRQWVDTSWYGDVSPVISFSDDNPLPDESIDIITTIHNYGEVNYTGMPVNIYEGTTLLDSLRLDVPALDSVIIATPITKPQGDYTIKVVMDENNIKIEKDETNNEDIAQINFGTCCIGIRGNIDNDIENVIDISDLVYMVDYQFRGGDAPPCLYEGDLVEPSDPPVIDIADLVFMVDYQFRDGDAPPECP